MVISRDFYCDHLTVFNILCVLVEQRQVYVGKKQPFSAKTRRNSLSVYSDAAQGNLEGYLNGWQGSEPPEIKCSGSLKMNDWT